MRKATKESEQARRLIRRYALAVHASYHGEATDAVEDDLCGYVAALEAENAALRGRFEALDAIESHGWYFDGRSCVTINCASRADAERVVAAIGAALATPAGGQAE